VGCGRMGDAKSKSRRDTITKSTMAYYLSDGTMTNEKFKEYIQADCQTEWQQYFDLEKGSDIEYKVFRFLNKDDKECEFSECWLLDSSIGYLPVIKTRINTSSRYSLWRCGMHEEESGDESEEKEKSWTLDEICDLLAPYTIKSSFKKIILRIQDHGEFFDYETEKIGGKSFQVQRRSKFQIRMTSSKIRFEDGIEEDNSYLQVLMVFTKFLVRVG
jgi:hypothetical protein